MIMEILHKLVEVVKLVAKVQNNIGVFDLKGRNNYMHTLCSFQWRYFCQHDRHLAHTYTLKLYLQSLTF